MTLIEAVTAGRIRRIDLLTLDDRAGTQVSIDSAPQALATIS